VVDVAMGSKDDAGTGQGRFQVDIEYDSGRHVGFKTRLRWEQWSTTPTTPQTPDFMYAFGYGRYFNDQLTFSIGRLGASPWGTGGPEMWRELEAGERGGVPGMRVEYQPYFIPGLNAGFVFNWFNGNRDNTMTQRVDKFTDLLQESVLGVSYTNSYFLARIGYRLDSPGDKRPGSGLPLGTNEGDDLVYRVEEYVLQRYVPGLVMWALGSYEGVGIGVDKSCINYQNWLFANYEAPYFSGTSINYTAQIRVGYDVLQNRNILHLRPSFFMNFFGKMLSVGGLVLYGQDFGQNRLYPGAPFTYLELRPKFQLNFGTTNIALEYSFRQEYINKEHEIKGAAPINQMQWLNLRFGITY
ncbi:MAG: hypothetical protein FWF29_10670, partial [Treponema sp.]|nr:hypothetical protein [Treponema sp.]